MSTTDAHRVEASALPLLGMLAYGQLAAFTRLSADSAAAPDLPDRLAFARLAGRALDHVDLLAERIVGLGADVEATMAPFAGVLVEFDRRTEPTTWWERILKGYVGYGVSEDFARLLAAGVDDASRGLVEDALGSGDLADLVVARLAAAGVEDPTLAARLALWGRRLVGESLGAVQAVVAGHPEIADVLAAALPGDDPQARLFSLLTAEHTRRMGRLGLAA